jgi:bacillithiol synthase
MELHKISFAETNSFSQSFLDYIQAKDSLKKFFNRSPAVSNFEFQVKEKAKSFTAETRRTLAETVTKQYSSIETTELIKKNLTNLTSENTFTVTTGHQLNIFTGPLYFIYKIVTVINTCKKLTEQYPEYNFVPVYWMASEDHDFDEIKYFRLYGNKYVWNSTQTGAVGRFNPKEIKALLNDVPGDTTVFKNAYLKHDTLADAVRDYVNTLFGSHGLIVVDGDSRELKSLFKNVIKDDLKNHTAKILVEHTNSELESLGYKTQVFARDINFFYLDKNLRSRIEKKRDGYAVLDTPISFSENEIITAVEAEPEKFSPNVILRPLYQETILPNLAYIGGPAEVVYWLQLKEVFQHYNTPFPILMPRNFALVMDAPTSRKFKKTGVDLNELFIEKNLLFNHYVTKFSEHKIKLNGEKEAIENYFDTIRQHAESFDKTLGPFVGAETKRAIKSLEKIESKLLKAEKRHQADKLRQIEAVKDSLFPNGGLQERTDNFLNFYQQNPHFIQDCLNVFDPFDFRFNILEYHDKA